MEQKFGAIAFVRPERSIPAEGIMHILSIAGKEVASLAYRSLAVTKLSEGNVYYKEYYPCVSDYNLAMWFEVFFNLSRGTGQGAQCVTSLKEMGIITTPGDHGGWNCPRFRLNDA